MEPLSLLTSAIPSIFDVLKDRVSKNGLNSNALKAASRALALELRQNLGIIDACLGDLDKLSSDDDSVIKAVVMKLEVGIASLLFAGMDRDIDQIELLASHVEKELRESIENFATKRPAKVGRDGEGKMSFSVLLGYIVRKTTEMQKLAELCGPGQVKLKMATNWVQRIKNLHNVMLETLRIIEKRPRAKTKKDS